MELMKEFKLLVILGAWNRSIFTGEWIKRYLLPDDEFTLEVSLDNSHRISSKKIRVEFHNNRLNFIPLIQDTETFQLIADLSVKIADYLPHTPVFGFGINFVFEYDSTKIKDDLIQINDIDKLNECGVTVLDSYYKHHVKYADIPINIAISKKNGKHIFDFNFHSDIDRLTKFKEKIVEFPIDKLLDIALEIMEKVYLLNMLEDV